MQIDPIKPTLKPSGTKRLKLKHDALLSNFAFNFNLRRYRVVHDVYTQNFIMTAIGEAVQVDPMKLNFKPPGTERLKLKCDDPL